MELTDEILCHFAAGTLPQLFVEHFRGHRRDEHGKNFLEALVGLHNSGVIDVLETARAISESSVSQQEFFLVQNVYVDIIPRLQASVPSMLAAVKALVARAGDDLASGAPNGAFRTWAESDDRAVATIAFVDPANPDDAAYLFLALQALSKTDAEAALDQALTFLGGQDDAARAGAAKAIGTLPLCKVETKARALDGLEAASRANAADNLLGQIIVAGVDIARKTPAAEDRVVRMVDAIAVNAGAQTIHHAVSTLMFHADDLSPAIVMALTKIAHRMRVENGGTIDRLDDAAAQLVRNNRIDEALALLVPILSAHEQLCSLEKFQSFTHSLLSLDRKRLADIIVTWLLTLDRNMGEAARSLVGDHHDGPLVLELDAANIGLSENEAIVLAHRTIGYLFLHPITAGSIVLSLVQIVSLKGRRTIEDILFEPLLINFSGDFADWLKVSIGDETDPARQTIKSLLARLDAYLEGLRRVGQINEFRPSERERLIEGHRQQESMRQLHKEAENRSIFMSLMSRSVLLYGTRSISYVQNPNGMKQRNEMKLHSFSHSFEAPRLDTIEPAELDYILRVFRAMRVAP